VLLFVRLQQKLFVRRTVSNSLDSIALNGFKS